MMITAVYYDMLQDLLERLRRLYTSSLGFLLLGDFRFMLLCLAEFASLVGR